MLKGNHALENNIGGNFILARFFLIILISDFVTSEKCEVFPGPYYPVFGVDLRIQSECGTIRTRKNSISGHFSYSVKSFFSYFSYFLLSLEVLNILIPIFRNTCEKKKRCRKSAFLGFSTPYTVFKVLSCNRQNPCNWK